MNDERKRRCKLVATDNAKKKNNRATITPMKILLFAHATFLTGAPRVRFVCVFQKLTLFRHTSVVINVDDI